MKLVLRFLSVGGISTLIQYAILVVLVEAFNTPPYIATTVGYGTSAIFNYLANYYFSFASNAGHFSAASKFFVVVLIGLSLNSSIVFILTELLQLNYLLGQLLATVVVTTSNFLLLKHWAYK